MYFLVHPCKFYFTSILTPSFVNFCSRFSYPLNIYSIFSILVVPFVAIAAKTNAAPPLRSVALTFEGYNLFTPFIIAVFPSIFIFAPILRSSPCVFVSIFKYVFYNY